MGEGHHFYKINGKYYIISADYSPVGRMQCARADRPEGPYETVVISHRETMGMQRGWWTQGYGFWSDIPDEGDKMTFEAPSENFFSAVPLHQGGIVDLPNGEWWGFSMMDMKSVGRLTYLSPVTWKDGWPYFGVEGNLGRSPRTWLKPNVGEGTTPHAPYVRDDDFSAKRLNPVWQWNHIPVKGKWKLTKGVLRLNTLPAKSLMFAKNTLTQRVVGPESIVTVELNARSCACTGSTKNDVFQNMMTYGLFTGGLMLHYGAERLGMMVIPSGSGNTKRQLQLMKDFRTTVVHATPSYLLHMYDVMKEEGFRPEDFALKKAECSPQIFSSGPASLSGVPTIPYMFYCTVEIRLCQ